MHDSDLIADFYDHEQDGVRRTADWGGDDLFTAAAPRRRRFERTSRLRDEPHAPPVPEPHAPPRGSEPEAYPEPRAEAGFAPERTLEPVPAGRRTVTITGRPDPMPAPRRPARTMDERIAHRPERIASWTCALGALSILLAVLTGS